MSDPAIDSPETFIAHWSPGGGGYAMSERAGAQPHFIGLCALLGVPAPDDAEHYTFEKGTLKLGQQRGYADVFKRGCFAWEYKAPGGDLVAALRQLKDYANALDNPPLLIVSDRLSFEIHTQFTGRPTEVYRIALKQLSAPEPRQLLRRAFTDPASFQPQRTNRDITEQAAKAFADVAERMRHERGEPPERVAHFLTQCLFCFFAEDVGLLPERLFEKLVAKQITPEKLRIALAELFGRMRDGGLFGLDDIPWFNGGLFKTIDVPLITPMDVAALKTASQLNWSAIDVAIFGTLFERGLDPKKRSQLGAHYTDPATIMRIVTPVVERPLRAEWAVARDEIGKLRAKSKKYNDAAYQKAKAAATRFLERLARYRVLDPACGSGNFLYLALKTLKDIEHSVHVDLQALELDRPVDLVTSPANVLGIELNEYAAELARVTVWIGELQWRLQHGYPFKQNPVLEPLDHIECRDALLTEQAENSLPQQGRPPSRSLPQRGRVGVGEHRTSPTPTKHFNPTPMPAELRAFVRTLRNQATDAERALWKMLRGKQLGVKFRRQHPIDGYVLDFYCVECKLAVELDGGQHNLETEQARDTRRSAQLAARDIEVLRFWNDEVFKNLDGVWTRIDEAIQRRRMGVELHPPAGDAFFTLPPPAGEAPFKLPPPAGEGWGGGTSHADESEFAGEAPPPQPSPAGGGSQAIASPAGGGSQTAAFPAGGGSTLRMTEATWPRADTVIGNPPFVGDKKMRAELGDEYTETLRKVYEGRVPGGADLVCYWFEKARAAIDRGDLKYAGLVSTNSIRQRANRSVIEGIISEAPIHAAWSDEAWVNDGAAVRVSIVCIGDRDVQPMLDGKPVSRIHADLTATSDAGEGSDLTQASLLRENESASYFGVCLAGPFKVPAATATAWLAQPNPDGKSNADVLRPIYNGADITRRWAGDWAVDFGARMTEQEAALYEAPFRQIERDVKPVRSENKRAARAANWWRHGEARPGLRAKLEGLPRYIVTPETAKHRLFVFFAAAIAPEHSLIVIPRADDTTLGLLSSRFHVLWATSKGGRMGLGNDPRYNSTATFETFPFPEGLTPRDTAHQMTETLDDGAVIPKLTLPPPAGEAPFTPPPPAGEGAKLTSPPLGEGAKPTSPPLGEGAKLPPPPPGNRATTPSASPAPPSG